MTHGRTISSGQIDVVKQVQGIMSVGPSGGLMSDWRKGEEDDYTLHTNLGNQVCPLMTT